MKVHPVIFAAVFSALCCIAAAQNQVCPSGTTYQSCGSFCRNNLTCDNYQNPPLVCPSVCVSGCFCNLGTVVRNGQCVAMSECSGTTPPTCSNGMVYSDCASPCNLTCDNYQSPPICPSVCRQGCACPSGMVLNNQGWCVSTTDCPRPTTTATSPPTCSNGMVYSDCASPCSLTCNNYQSPPACPTVCRQGCACPTGTVLNNGRCIATTECPTPTTTPDVCSLPPATGVCFAAFRRFFFNSTARICQQFTYGGCGGNGNNFNTGEECLQRCGNPCATVRCGIPFCPNGDTPTTPDGQCCPQCPNPPTCPRGVSAVTCFANPCSGATCPNQPEARCVPNFCGQCSAEFYDSSGNNVTARCTGSTTCPDGTSPVRCFADPCTVNTCPGIPEARCVANYCGGCNTEYYDTEGNNVTARCTAVVPELPTPRQVGVCPAISAGVGGDCSQQCMGDDSCRDGMKCCSNGCGTACMEPTLVPVYDIPLQCPHNESSDRLGICIAQPNSCQSDDSCTGNKLCCRSGCGRVCTTPVVATQPCYAITYLFNRSSTSGLGAAIGSFIPRCDTDGSFQPIQCHGSTGYCWCVHTQTGLPLSSPVRGLPQCSVNCTYNENTYYPGQNYASTDGCNDCWCTDTGVTACTRRACIDTCSLASDPGPCRGAFTTYYYDSRSSSCRNFTYGGCGGNDNKFESVRDCLSRCDQDNRCLLRPEVGPCEALIPSFFFNATSGRCERFNYGGCQGNENRFTSGEDCQRACDPSRPVDRCLRAPCPLLPCPESQQTRIPGECCAQCVQQECRDDQFMCSNGTCIPGSFRCDGWRDCSNREDEADCRRTCDFMCGDGVCIPERYVCDGYLDCRDGSDARNCPTEFDNTFYPQDIPRQCPNATGLIGACVVECSGDDDCENGGLCCSNGCGRTCMRGEPVTPLCPALLRQTSPSLIGAFVPSCERDGSFSQVQCHGSTGFCWCVDTTTGQPQGDGMRGERPECEVCTDHNGITYTIGETFRAEDGCNTCFCSASGANCTRIRCAPSDCVLKDVTISHNKSYSDSCSNITCQFGTMRYLRKPCPLVQDSPDTKPTIVTMKFSGNLNDVAPSDDHKQNLKREVMKTFVEKYEDTLGLVQEQIKAVDLKSGSVIIIVTLNGTESTAIAGANLTILLSQLEQDYMSGTFVIRYNSQALEPTGEIQVGEPEDDGGFPWWGILIVCIGGLLLVMVVVIVLAGVLIGLWPKDFSYRETSADDYEASYKNGSVDVKPKM